MPKTHLKTPLLRHSGNQAKPEHPESPTAIRDAGQDGYQTVTRQASMTEKKEL